jgi:hypothetical protein
MISNPLITNKLLFILHPINCLFVSGDDEVNVVVDKEG